MPTAFYQILAVLCLTGALSSRVAAEEFRYYVWVDGQGVVHAEEKAPKGRDYKIRVIEDINANVVPAKDFRIGALPADFRSTADNIRDADTPPAEAAGRGKIQQPAAPSSPAADK